MPPNNTPASRQIKKENIVIATPTKQFVSLVLYISATNLYNSYNSRSEFWQVSCVESSVRLCWFTDVAEYMDEHSRAKIDVVCRPHAVFTFSFWHWTVFPNWMICCLATICALQYGHEWIRILFIHVTLGISKYIFLSPSLLLTL